MEGHSEMTSLTRIVRWTLELFYLSAHAIDSAHQIRAMSAGARFAYSSELFAGSVISACITISAPIVLSLQSQMFIKGRTPNAVFSNNPNHMTTTNGRMRSRLVANGFVF